MDIQHKLAFLGDPKGSEGGKELPALGSSFGVLPTLAERLGALVDYHHCETRSCTALVARRPSEITLGIAIGYGFVRSYG